MLENLIGHQKVKELLLSMLESQKIPHAFLFHGEVGIGKMSFAKAFAKDIIQRRGQDHPDIRIYLPDEKSDLHTIASIRELKEEVYLPPFESRYKVFIIQDAHKMVSSCSQALLKTLEEPSAFCKIILVTENINDLLPTIISRCCKIAFSPLQEEEIISFLLMQKSVDKDIAQYVAKNSFGSLEKALAFVNEEERLWQEALLELVFQFKILSPDLIQEKLTFLEEQVEKRVSCTVENIYEVILRCIRDLIVVRQGLDSKLLFFRDKEDVLVKVVEKITHSFDAMEKLWQQAKESDTYHVKLKVAIETLLIRLYEQNTRAYTTI